MNTLINHLRNLYNVFRCICGMLRYAVTFIVAMLSPKVKLAARLLAAESQLAVCKHGILEKKNPRPRFTAGFRLLWVLLSRFLDKWEDCFHLMKLATVTKWHTKAFRCYWWWKPRNKGGRPPISKEMQELIRRLFAVSGKWDRA